MRMFLSQRNLLEDIQVACSFILKEHNFFSRVLNN